MCVSVDAVSGVPTLIASSVSVSARARMCLGASAAGDLIGRASDAEASVLSALRFPVLARNGKSG
jgi:hypothetical protein